MEAIMPVESLRREIMLTSSCAWRTQLTAVDLDRWLNNFNGDCFDKAREQHLALWLLNNFVYYNKQEVRHLCSVLFSRFLHGICKTPHSGSISRWLEAQIATSTFANLGNPGESGAFLLYLFRQVNDLRVSSFEDRARSLKDTKHYVLIDDVCLTGSQLKDYAQEHKKALPNDCKLYFLTLMATRDALDFVASQGIIAHTAIELAPEEKCFSPGSRLFRQLPHLKPEIELLCRHYGKLCSPINSLGYRDEGRLIGFFYNTPDNTLPIFWAHENGWKPIFRRFHKNYRISANYGLSRFI